MNVWTMAIICGIFSTFLLDPYFIYRFFKGVKNSIKSHKPCFEFKIKRKARFWGLQIVVFVLGTLITGGLMSVFATVRTLLGMTDYFWIVAILHFINAFQFDDYYDEPESESICGSGVLMAIIIAVIFAAPYVHSWFYNPMHPVESHTYLQEEQVPVVSTDVLKSLEEECILDGYSLKDPVFRQGKVVYPLERGGNVAIAGYIMVEDENVTFVEQELPFNPYQMTKNAPNYVFREHLPTKVGFSDGWSFQLDPEGQVWFAGMYGEHTCLKAGRKLEGIALVNGSTGEFVTYRLDEIPTWITGISE